MIAAIFSALTAPIFLAKTVITPSIRYDAQIFMVQDERKPKSEINPIFLAGLEIGRVCASHNVAFNNAELDHYRDEFLSRYMQQFALSDGEWQEIQEALQYQVESQRHRLTRDDCFQLYFSLTQNISAYTFE